MENILEVKSMNKFTKCLIIVVAIIVFYKEILYVANGVLTEFAVLNAPILEPRDVYLFVGLFSVSAFVFVMAASDSIIKAFVGLIVSWMLLFFFVPLFRWGMSFFAFPQSLHLTIWLSEKTILVLLLFATWVILFPSLQEAIKEARKKCTDEETPRHIG